MNIRSIYVGKWYITNKSFIGKVINKGPQSVTLEVYTPFCGIISISPNDIYDKAINLLAFINLKDGYMVSIINRTITLTLAQSEILKKNYASVDLALEEVKKVFSFGAMRYGIPIVNSKNDL